MLADITLFENFANSVTTGGAAFNNATIWLDEYAQTKQAVGKCKEIVDSLRGENAVGISDLLGAVAGSQHKLETEMASQRRNIGEELEDGLTDEERRALFMLDLQTQEDFKAIIGSDAILRRAKEMISEQNDET